MKISRSCGDRNVNSLIQVQVLTIITMTETLAILFQVIVKETMKIVNKAGETLAVLFQIHSHVLVIMSETIVITEMVVIMAETEHKQTDEISLN